MRLKISKCKNTNLYYVIKTIYINGKEKTITVEKLGNEKEILKKSNGENPKLWAKKYIDELNKKEKEKSLEILIPKFQNKQIQKDIQVLYNCGYLFLEKIYFQLEINNICNEIKNKYNFKYDLNNILSRLIYSRIIYPSSKLKTFEESKKFVEQPNFELHDIYRALEVLTKENDFIQAKLYKNSKKIIKRDTSILYYDCTNYFFEIEEEDGIKQYGPSKEHRPNPITQMGLFMDKDGIPLAFSITPGNTNEQLTLTPLENKLIQEFNLSKFVVCTDAGLASTTNRKFNNVKNRAFITTQSLKKIKKHLMDWALSTENWNLVNDKNKYNINSIDENEEIFKDKIFFKERWINENGIEQKLIVTYSLKYKNYQRKIRNSQIERAKSALENNNLKLDKINQNDYKRFVKKTNITKEGEIAENKIYAINKEQIEKEEKFDGFYAVCTNLNESPEEIININKKRWEIEENFRIMKSEFKARPVFLNKDIRIKAHFLVCFLALVIYRILEKNLEEKYTSYEIISCLRNMNLSKEDFYGYIPLYIRNDLTDDLHNKFGFRTDYQIISLSEIKKILSNLKK